MRRVAYMKPMSALLLFLAVWWLGPGILQRFTRVSFYEFQAPVTIGQSQLQDMRRYWELRSRSKNTLIEENVRLARALSNYRTMAGRNAQLEAEIEQFEELLDMRSAPEFDYEVARVAQRQLSAWWQQVIIRKGSSNGITVGAGVVWAGGVVGRVREVRLNTAVVELVSSPNFKTAAIVEGEEQFVTYQGAGAQALSPGRGQVRNVAPEMVLAPGQTRQLFSSPLGGTFPPGFLIGEVVSLEPSAGGYFQQGDVRIDPELSNLREVTVLLPRETEPLAESSE